MELLSIARATTDRALRDRLDVLCDRLAPPREPALIDVPRLTSRELQVLGEIALGRTNNEVAEHLSIMPTKVLCRAVRYRRETCRPPGQSAAQSARGGALP
jgi:ATP/maltotriose-dependent transcriptional regulator MalT